MNGRRRGARGAAIATALVATAALFPNDARGAAPTNERISVADDESQATQGGRDPSFSADGRFVAFESTSPNLVFGDTNNALDVFVRDRVNGTTERVSVDSNEIQAIGTDSLPMEPTISADGRLVVFHSAATNLVTPPTPPGPERLYLRDRVNGTTELVSVSSDEVAGSTGTGGVVNADGRFVAFQSGDASLVPADTNGTPDVFVRDRTNGTTERVSVNSDEAQSVTGPGDPVGPVPRPAISYDGRFVAFATPAGNLVSGDNPGGTDIFVRDRTNGTTERVSTAADGTPANEASGESSGPVISADGRYVVFESGATNLLGPATSPQNHVFRKDRLTGAVILASQRSDGAAGNGASPGAPDAGGSGIAVSPDGRFIVFSSDATNLVSSGADTMGFTDVFVHDAITRQTVRVSEGSEANNTSANPTASGASEAAFDSMATNLIAAGTDTNASTDVYARHFRRPTGYFVLDDQGGIFTFGGAQFRGSVPALRAAGTPVGAAPIVDLEVTPSGNGYYVLDDAGGIFTFGDAPFFGSVPGLRAAGACTCPARILDMAVTPTGRGYLILDDQGGIFTFGDAAFFGSIPQLRAAGVPVGSALGVDLSITPTGNGYLILDDTGGIFTFGDARFFGSLPGLRAGGAAIGSAPSIRMATSPSGNGYLILDNVGGMFTFGDAQFFGSIPGLRAAGVPIGNAAGVDLAITPTGLGYVILDDQGGMFTFGDGEFFGSIPQLRNAGVAVGPNTSIRVDLVSALVGG